LKRLGLERLQHIAKVSAHTLVISPMVGILNVKDTLMAEPTMTRVLIIGLAVLTLAACETTKGAGKDIQKAGDAITEAATDVQKTL